MLIDNARIAVILLGVASVPGCVHDLDRTWPDSALDTRIDGSHDIEADLGSPDMGEQDGEVDLGRDMSPDTTTAADLTADLPMDATRDIGPYCGDNVINGSSEVCDGTALGGETCKTQGFFDGVLKCAAGCAAFDTSACHNCGNGLINPGEQCDTAELGTATCTSLSFDGGTLACRGDCTYDTSSCYTCGDDEINPGEQCDGDNLGGGSCSTEGFDGGTLKCNGNCTFDTSDCYTCGDDEINPGEQCDTSELGGITCISLSFDGGTLKCYGDCTFDTSDCYACGDDAINPGEQCDGTNLGGRSCTTEGFDSGTLSCQDNCTLDTFDCASCGDGAFHWSEQCDIGELGGESCSSVGFDGGTLACLGTCTFDTTGCTYSSIPGQWATILAGSFNMGSPPTEICRQTDEVQHQVTLTRDFEISAHEVTQAEYLALRGYNPSYYSACGVDCPVEQVSWHEAAAYCNELSTARGLTECYTCSGSGASVSCTEAPAYGGAGVYDCPGYRLPTEAEWEYACRAGSTTAFYPSPGNDGTNTSCSIDLNVDKIGWYKFNAAVTYPGCDDLSSTGGPSCTGTHPTGGKAPNALGLYDMSGNVWEWCHDWYQDNLGSTAVTNPWGAASGVNRVIHGGSWKHEAQDLRSSNRLFNPPTTQYSSIGFRCCRGL